MCLVIVFKGDVNMFFQKPKAVFVPVGYFDSRIIYSRSTGPSKTTYSTSLGPHSKKIRTNSSTELDSGIPSVSKKAMEAAAICTILFVVVVGLPWFISFLSGV